MGEEEATGSNSEIFGHGRQGMAFLSKDPMTWRPGKVRAFTKIHPLSPALCCFRELKSAEGARSLLLKAPDKTVPTD
jgi:hypothetical protein